MPRLFKPNLRLHRVEQLDVAMLERLGIKSLLLDVDCTLKSYRDQIPPKEITAWIESLRRQDIGLCLVSNGRGRRIATVARHLDLPFVAAALKPLPRGCREALSRMGFDRRHTAMVGDQVFADIMAGNLAGLLTILIDPIHPEQEPWYTRSKRPLEQLFVRRVAHEPPESNG